MCSHKYLLILICVQKEETNKIGDIIINNKTM